MPLVLASAHASALASARAPVPRLEVPPPDLFSNLFSHWSAARISASRGNCANAVEGMAPDGEPPEPEGPAASTSGNAFEAPLLLSSSSVLMSTLPGRLWMLSASLRGEKGRSMGSACPSGWKRALSAVADAGTETHLMVNRSSSQGRSGGTGPRRVHARLPRPIQASAGSGAPMCRARRHRRRSRQSSVFAAVSCRKIRYATFGVLSLDKIGGLSWVYNSSFRSTIFSQSSLQSTFNPESRTHSSCLEEFFFLGTYYTRARAL